MKKSRKEILIAKLGTPLHIDYIADNILFETKEKALSILNELENDGFIESDNNKQYYKNKKK